MSKSDTPLPVIELESYPPVETWDDVVDLDPAAWPRRVERHSMLVPTTCFNCEAGCGLMAWVALDIPPTLYVDRLTNAVSLWTLLVGLVKAPVFGALIGLVGCYAGLQTGGSADSLGRQTTVAVVQAIFIVIVVDAIFSIFFNIVGV